MWSFAGDVVKIYGAPGVMILFLATALYFVDREKNAEKNARIEDAKNTLNLLLSWNEKQHAAIDKLADLVEFIEKRDRDREFNELKARVLEERESKSRLP